MAILSHKDIFEVEKYEVNWKAELVTCSLARGIKIAPAGTL
jgi:hypothetical protein